MANLFIDDRQLEAAQKIINELQDRPNFPSEDIGLLVARAEFAQGHWLTARQGFEKVRAAFSSRPAFQKQIDVLIGECYGFAGDYDLQEKAYRRALAIDPFYLPARKGVFRALQAAGRLEDAMTEFGQLGKIGGLGPAGPAMLTRMLIASVRQQPVSERNWERVEKALEEAELASTDRQQNARLRSEVLIAENRLSDAERVLLEALGRNPMQGEVLLALASLASRQQQWGKAEKLLADAQQVLGDGAPERAAQAEYFVSRYGAKAAEQIQSLAENTEKFSDADLPQLWRGLLTPALQAGDMALVKQLCQRILEKEPANIQVRFLLFDFAMQDRDDAAMEKTLADIERVTGHSAYWCYGQAVRLSLRAKSHPDDKNALLSEALGYLAKARELRPSWTRISMVTADIYEQQGKLHEALESDMEAIELGDRSAAVIQRATNLLYQQQRYADADQLLRRLETQQVALSPEVNLMGAATAYYQGEFDRALEMARKAVSEDSTNYEQHLSLGHMLKLLGRQAKAEGKGNVSEPLLADAEKAFRRAVELKPEAPETWVALIQFLGAAGRIDEAKKSIAEAVEDVRRQGGVGPRRVLFCDQRQRGGPGKIRGRARGRPPGSLGDPRRGRFLLSHRQAGAGGSPAGEAGRGQGQGRGNRRHVGPPSTGDDLDHAQRLCELPEGEGIDREEPGARQGVGSGSPREGPTGLPGSEPFPARRRPAHV